MKNLLIRKVISNYKMGVVLVLFSILVYEYVTIKFLENKHLSEYFGFSSGHMIYYELMKRETTCYKTKDNIMKSSKHFVPAERNIYFIETSCKGGLNSRQSCSIESAALKNPTWQITIFFIGPLSPEFASGRTYLKLTSLANVKLLRINITEFAKDTPVQNLFTNDSLSKSKYAIEHGSDIVRIVILYKYGGVYLDTDVIVIKPFSDLPDNFVAKQSDVSVANGILAFSKDGIGKNLSKTALRDLSASYNPKGWGDNGPDLILRTLKKICSTKEISKMSNVTCNGLHIYDEKYFFPLKCKDRRVYYMEQNINSSDAYTHHIWIAFSWTEATSTRIASNSLYGKLAKKHCPAIYALYGQDFGL